MTIHTQHEVVPLFFSFFLGGGGGGGGGGEKDGHFYDYSCT